MFSAEWQRHPEKKFATGPMADDPSNGIGTVLVVLLILWMALHSAKIISAVFLNLFIGLSITTAAGLWMVGSLNLLSIAFAFCSSEVGRGFRHPVQRPLTGRKRFKSDDSAVAAQQAAERSRSRFSLAAMATAADLLSFLPTDYGISELARSPAAQGCRRFLTSITVAAALLSACLNLPEKEIPSANCASRARSMISLKGIASSLSPGTLLIAVAGLPLLYFLQSISTRSILRSPKVESIATFLI